MYMHLVIHQFSVHVVILIEVLFMVCRGRATSLVASIIHDFLERIYTLRARLHQFLCCLATVLQAEFSPQQGRSCPEPS